MNDYEILTTGDGGIYSNIQDLFLWDQALYTNQLASIETLEKAFKPNILSNGEKKNYGYGWVLDPDNEIVFHGGNLGGYKTYIRRDLKNKRTLILLSNFTNEEGLKEIPKEIGKILNDKNYDPKLE